MAGSHLLHRDRVDCYSLAHTNMVPGVVYGEALAGTELSGGVGREEGDCA